MPREEASTIQFIWCSIWKRFQISGAVENELSTLDSFLQRVSVKQSTKNPPNRSNSPFGAAKILLRAKS